MRKHHVGYSPRSLAFLFNNIKIKRDTGLRIWKAGKSVAITLFYNDKQLGKLRVRVSWAIGNWVFRAATDPIPTERRVPSRMEVKLALSNLGQTQPHSSRKSSAGWSAHLQGFCVYWWEWEASGHCMTGWGWTLFRFFHHTSYPQLQRMRMLRKHPLRSRCRDKTAAAEEGPQALIIQKSTQVGVQLNAFSWDKHISVSSIHMKKIE